MPCTNPVPYETTCRKCDDGLGGPTQKGKSLSLAHEQPASVEGCKGNDECQGNTGLAVSFSLSLFVCLPVLYVEGMPRTHSSYPCSALMVVSIGVRARSDLGGRRPVCPKKLRSAPFA